MSLRALALAAVLLAACGPKLHTGTGTVKEVRPDLRQLVLDHEDIEGLMPAMTMNFDVAAPELLAGLAPGDRVRFELSVDGEHYRIVAIERLGAGEADAVGEAGSSGLTAVAPEQDPAPAFALVDQDGRPLSLESLRGKVVLLDFVYTSCPGPCPIQTGMHVRVQQELPEPVRPQVWFASISLDPLRDTPEKLRAYAKARGADLASWSFLTGPRETVERGAPELWRRHRPRSERRDPARGRDVPDRRAGPDPEALLRPRPRRRRVPARPDGGRAGLNRARERRIR